MLCVCACVCVCVCARVCVRVCACVCVPACTREGHRARAWGQQTNDSITTQHTGLECSHFRSLVFRAFIWNTNKLYIFWRWSERSGTLSALFIHICLMQRHGAKGSVTNDSRSEHEQKCQEDFFFFFFMWTDGWRPREDKRIQLTWESSDDAEGSLRIATAHVRIILSYAGSQGVTGECCGALTCDKLHPVFRLM